jgi:ADP-ribose pyrophosphatase
MQKDQHLIEKTIASDTVFEGSFLKIKRDTVELPNGKTTTREYINHPGAAAIIAITKDNQIIMERQYRHCVGEILLEIPAGKIDAQEEPLTAAKRELLEETGISAKEWIYLGHTLPCVGYSSEKITFYLAQELELGEAKLDDGEFLDVLFMDLNECLNLAYSGQIKDTKTLSGLMLYLGHKNR